MNIVRKFLIVVMAAMFLLSGGCLFDSHGYHPVKNYDLKISTPQMIPDTMVKFRLSGANDISKYKMVYRDAKCQVLVDEYNKWIQPPEFMTARHLQGIFSRFEGQVMETAHNYLVEGNIFLFVADVDKMSVFFGMAYKLHKVPFSSDNMLFEESVVFSVPVKDITPDSYAAAMTVAVDKFAARLREVIKDVQQEKVGKKQQK